MSERNKDILGIPTDFESYRVVPKALADFIGSTASGVVGTGHDFVETVTERSKKAGQSAKGAGSTALSGVIRSIQLMGDSARARLSGLPGLHDLHPDDDPEVR